MRIENKITAVKKLPIWKLSSSPPSPRKRNLEESYLGRVENCSVDPKTWGRNNSYKMKLTMFKTLHGKIFTKN